MAGRITPLGVAGPVAGSRSTYGIRQIGIYLTAFSVYVAPQWFKTSTVENPA